MAAALLEIITFGYRLAKLDDTGDHGEYLEDLQRIGEASATANRVRPDHETEDSALGETAGAISTAPVDLSLRNVAPCRRHRPSNVRPSRCRRGSEDLRSCR